MKIQVNSDENITVDARLISFIRGEAERVLGRFQSRLTRLEVHLSDVNSHKFGVQDKRCSIEARPAGRQPLAASILAPTVKSAVNGSLSKMKNALERYFGRLRTGSKTRPAKPRAADVIAKSAPPLTRSAATAGKPAKRTAAKKTRVEKAETAAAGKGQKKAIYQARRKSWPARRTFGATS